ncbi:hypothetical protein NKG94_42685 [Micromonospora sp. M12]
MAGLGAFLSLALAFAFNAWYAVTVLGGEGGSSAPARSSRPRRRRRRTSTPRVSTSG